MRCSSPRGRSIEKARWSIGVPMACSNWRGLCEQRSPVLAAER
ncbi:hypothetical protein [Citreimonas sp.]